jgi:hypothetical protein
MSKIVFTQQLRRFTETPEFESAGTTLRAVLEQAFERNPRLRGYVVDEQGSLRQHVVVFIDGERLRDRSELDITLSPHSNIHVLQALSGG